MRQLEDRATSAVYLDEGLYCQSFREVDGLAASQGSAVDLGLRAGFDLTPQWQATLGWRMLTGGVDNDTTYNFATFQTITAGVAYRF